MELTIKASVYITVALTTSSLGCFKLNFDGNTIGNPAIVGIGEVVWDCNASHALSFSGPLGFFLVNRRSCLSSRRVFGKLFVSISVVYW